ncbi:hypothetical protein K432DRAFT_446804 [Lepidopterella palustris CBS 459.81]|uniref:Uncharacterized protein n=1 Tax=Lepidopterella palustris CBS 459.81 TaxID=1314670 RepID=A0A8E2E171_9PEZI|nr:hypothetical protein K432DRAFT_446804 [Lepidopterella palustris CBS 459.81]
MIRSESDLIVPEIELRPFFEEADLFPSNSAPSSLSATTLPTGNSWGDSWIGLPDNLSEMPIPEPFTVSFEAREEFKAEMCKVKLYDPEHPLVNIVVGTSAIDTALTSYVDQLIELGAQFASNELSNVQAENPASGTSGASSEGNQTTKAQPANTTNVSMSSGWVVGLFFLAGIAATSRPQTMFSLDAFSPTSEQTQPCLNNCAQLPNPFAYLLPSTPPQPNLAAALARPRASRMASESGDEGTKRNWEATLSRITQKYEVHKARKGKAAVPPPPHLVVQVDSDSDSGGGVALSSDECGSSPEEIDEKGGWAQQPNWEKIRRVDFRFNEPHIGYVNLERFLHAIPFAPMGRTKVSFVDRAFRTAAAVFDEHLFATGVVVLKRFLECLSSDSKGFTTVEKVETAFCMVAREVKGKYDTDDMWSRR